MNIVVNSSSFSPWVSDRNLNNGCATLSSFHQDVRLHNLISCQYEEVLDSLTFNTLKQHFTADAWMAVARGPSLSEISYTCIEIPRNLQKSLEISGNLWKSLRLCAKSRDPEESSQFDGKSPRNPEISQKSWKSRRNLL